MRDIWVISDTHIGHTNFLRFTDQQGNIIRPFANTKEMDDRILEGWNSVVKPGDLVYHLGDVFIGNKTNFKGLWPKFHGSKRLIVGNHDDIKFLSSGSFFQKVLCWRVWREFNLVFSHIPLHPDSFSWRGMLNVHGHIHERKSPDGPYRNVSVEVLDYTPIHIEELAKEAKDYNENSKRQSKRKTPTETNT